MRWDLNWGPQQAFVDSRVRRGLSVSERPEIWPHLAEVYDCFVTCGRRRPERTSAVPIAEIVAWFDLHGITDTETRVTYFGIVENLDRQYVDLQGKKQKDADSTH